MGSPCFTTVSTTGNEPVTVSPSPATSTKKPAFCNKVTAAVTSRLTTDGTVTFPVPFANANYTLVFGSSGSENGVPREIRSNRTNATFDYSSANSADTDCCWYACGYVS